MVLPVVSDGLGEVVDSGEAERAGGKVAEGGQGSGGRASPGPTGVLAKDGVANQVGTVLDRPMGPDERGEVGRPGLMGVEAGDREDGSARLPAALGLAAAAVYPDRGDRAREQQLPGRGVETTDLDRAGLDAAVPGL
jgi:hypothetical protein